MATDVDLGMLSLEELKRLLGQSQLANPYSQMGVSPYQQIMSQMTPTMNPYTGAGVAIGGYDPALYRRMSGSGLINLGQGGGGGGGGASGRSGSSGDSYSPSGPPPTTTPEEFEAQSARNQQLNDFLTGLTKMSPTGLLMSGFNTLFGSQRPAPVEDVGSYFGKNPINDFGFATQAEADAINAALNAQSMQSMQDALNADVAAAQGLGGGGGEGIGGGDISGQSEGTPALAMGGPVDRVGGPNPPGPDDGAGMLQLGEYVIKKSAVNKYGTGLLDMINNGKIPAKKMKSLLG